MILKTSFEGSKTIRLSNDSVIKFYAIEIKAVSYLQENFYWVEDRIIDG